MLVQGSIIFLIAVAILCFFQIEVNEKTLIHSVYIIINIHDTKKKYQNVFVFTSAFENSWYVLIAKKTKIICI